MIDHEEIQRLARRGVEIVEEGPGLGGRFDDACLTRELARMSRTYISLAESAWHHQDDGRKPVPRVIAEEQVAIALVSGMAMMVAYYEPQIERLLAERGRVSLLAPALGDGRPRAV